MTNDSSVCNGCGVELTAYNQYPSDRKGNYHQCIECRKARAREWNYKNRGGRPMTENPGCPQYFGVVIGETVLHSVFKDVVRMPVTNPGFDFVCNNGWMVDLKCGCLSSAESEKTHRWYFNIFKNTTADFFLCLAFDDRTNYNPIHAWLIPGHVVNGVNGVAISETSLDKWADYELDIDDIESACDAMKRDGVVKLTADANKPRWVVAQAGIDQMAMEEELYGDDEATIASMLEAKGVSNDE